ncbi:MAG: choice-of-anchor X domain-containing protein, partial [Candidatus Poseidoniales archaeon]
DGVLVAQANLGVFTPFTSQATWQKMYDDGSNGDAVANDGIYSVEMQVRSSIPIGTHEVLIQASDVYGKVSPTTSIAVQLVEEQSVLTGVSGSILTTGVLLGILVVFGIGVTAIVVISIRNRPESEQGQDRFGFN